MSHGVLGLAWRYTYKRKASVLSLLLGASQSEVEAMFYTSPRRPPIPQDDPYLSHVPLSQFVQMLKTVPQQADHIN